MITLKTLPQASAQEVFDQVAGHLLKQNERSGVFCEISDRITCKYRHDNLKCAAGCLIGDDEYTPQFEGSEWGHLADLEAVPYTHLTLISDLQAIHDYVAVEDWAEELKNFARNNHLDWKF